MWVLEPAVDVLRWYETRSRKQGELTLQGAISVTEVPGLAQSREPIGYLLAHGARAFLEAVTPLNHATLDRIEGCIPFYSGYNSLCYLLAREGLETFPERAQFILCETAFFADLPEEAAALGLPYEFFQKGVRRYGTDGIYHALAWQHWKKEAPGLCRLLSVHLGNQPNVAAILDGKALETSAGFTEIAGIPGQFSSGDVDPAIPLLLVRSGWDADSIAFLVTSQAGLQMTSGTNGSLIELIEAEPNGLTSTMLSASVLKAVGKCLAALEGADALVFGGEVIDRWSPLVAEVTGRIAFTAQRVRILPVHSLEISRMDVLMEVEKWITAF